MTPIKLIVGTIISLNGKMAQVKAYDKFAGEATTAELFQAENGQKITGIRPTDMVLPFWLQLGDQIFFTDRFWEVKSIISGEDGLEVTLVGFSGKRRQIDLSEVETEMFETQMKSK